VIINAKCVRNQKLLDIVKTGFSFKTCFIKTTMDEFEFVNDKVILSFFLKAVLRYRNMVTLMTTVTITVKT
jgi:hypothetical protein